MRANDVQSTDAIRHGAYVCLSVPRNARREVARLAVPAIVERLGLQNEFESRHGDPPASIAFLRREDATSADIADDELLRADVVVHVASATGKLVAEFCAELTRLVGPASKPRVIGGVVRPMNYTSTAMFNFAYAHRVLQQPGTVMPHAFLVPMSKTSEWWAKDWMERHTYFLPRYDDSGRMLNEGHALAAAAGIAGLMRRTYKHELEPAPAGAYEFVSYFECANEDVATFHEVCAALRDVAKNPEWKFVREGPTWHGRRVATWAELFD
jgi:hypothetical protein